MLNAKNSWGIRDLALILVIFKIIGFSGVLLNIEIINRLVLTGVVEQEQSYLFSIFTEFVSILFRPLFIPTSIFSIIWFYFALQILLMCGRSLEHSWGTKTFTLYILINLAINSLFIHFGYHMDFITTTVFLAFAFTFPTQEFLAMLFIPVKAKTLGIIALIFLVIMLKSPLLIFFGLSNFIFFIILGKFPLILNWRRQKHKKKFTQAEIIKNSFLHECYYCGLTDRDNRDLQFRVSSQDNHEYCLQHLDPANR